MRRLVPAAVAGALMLLFAPDCTLESAPPAAGGAGGEAVSAEAGEEGPVIGAAVWRLTWDRAGVIADARGPGWSVVNDLGYQVHVVSGWVLDHSVSLGPCAPAQVDGGTSWFSLRFGIRSAFAHEDADASAIEAMHAEDLTHLGDSGPWPSVFPKTRYCRAHWLAARATAKTDAPAGVDLAQTSVRVSGSWERGGETGIVDLDTWWPQGALQDLADITDPTDFAAAVADGEARWAWVTVDRKLGSLFDGIDFAEDSEAEATGKLVDNLVSTATMRAELRAPNGG